jgi:hypothetical protein
MRSLLTIRFQFLDAMPNPFGRRVFLRHSANLLGFTGLALVSCNSASKGSTSTQPQTTAVSKTMKLESTAFTENGMIRGTPAMVKTCPPLSAGTPHQQAHRASL